MGTLQIKHNDIITDVSSVYYPKNGNFTECNSVLIFYNGQWITVNQSNIYLNMYKNGISSFPVYAKPLDSNPYGFGSAALRTSNAYLSNSTYDYNRASCFVIGSFRSPKSTITLQARVTCTFGRQGDGRNGFGISLQKNLNITDSYIIPDYSNGNVGIGSCSMSNNFSGTMSAKITNIDTTENIYVYIWAWAHNNAQSPKNASYACTINEVWIEG